MLGLYLLAAHLVGSFIVRSRWRPNDRWKDWRSFTYTIPFWPIAAVYGRDPWWHGGAFGAALVFGCELIGEHRFRSTLGDVIQWQYDRIVNPAATTAVWVDFLYGPDEHPRLNPEIRVARARDLTARALRFPPPNPWLATPLMIDQTLHVCLLALLGGLLLQ